MNYVQTYYNYWSQPGTNVEQLSGYYNTTVNFYGANTPRAKVMDGKRQFANRWPIRHFTVQPNTLYAQCTDTLCAVSGVVEWDTSSVERNDHSVGSAKFIVGIAPLLGLVGTIFGMITVFGDIGQTGLNTMNDASKLAQGISLILRTTLIGLLISIPSLVAWSYFNKKVEVLAVEMETLCDEFIRRQYRHEKD